MPLHPGIMLLCIVPGFEWIRVLLVVVDYVPCFPHWGLVQFDNFLQLVDLFMDEFVSMYVFMQFSVCKLPFSSGFVYGYKGVQGGEDLLTYLQVMKGVCYRDAGQFCQCWVSGDDGFLRCGFKQEFQGWGEGCDGFWEPVWFGFMDGYEVFEGE